MTLTIRRLILSAVIAIPLAGFSQLTVDETPTPEEVVQNVLLGTGVEAFNITFSGDLDQIGTFDCVNCGVGIPTGVVLSSGNVNVAEGPNNSGSDTQGGGNFGADDPDLETLSTFAINDAAILEFDFIPQGDSVKFNYVFGSEEYNEYVCGSVNDAFGFFLSGPGITGPYTNNSINLAQVPDTNIPVTINTVNNGTVGSNGTLSNCTAVSPNWNQNTEYFINNSGNADPIGIEFDGYTVVLTAAAEVICGETYHIKICIGDGGDTAFDSGVFLQESSFTSNQIQVDLTIADLGVNDSTIWEGCGSSYIEFIRPSNGLPDELSFDITVGGTATPDEDYPAFPPIITFPYDVYVVQIPFSAINDGITEGLESVTIAYESETPCTDLIETQTVTFYIADVPDIVIELPDQVIDCNESALLTPEVTGGYGIYTYEWDTGETTDEITVSPPNLVPTDYLLTVMDTCGFGPFEYTVNVSFPDYPDLSTELGDPLEVNCTEDIVVAPVSDGGFPDYTYQWYDSAENPISADPILNWQNTEEGYVVLVLTDACGVETSDTVDYSFPPIPVIVDLGPDFDVTCLDVTTLSAEVQGGVGVGGFTYQWYEEGDAISTELTVDVQISEMTVYQLEATDVCGNVGTDELVLDVPPVPVIVDLGPDLIVTCVDTTLLDGNVIGGVGNYSYSWSNGTYELSTDPTMLYNTEVTAELFLTVEDECSNVGLDSIILEIPGEPIFLTTHADTTICLGDTITIWAEASGGQGGYTYYWLPLQAEGPEHDILPFNSTTYQVFAEDVCDNATVATVNINVQHVYANFDFDYAGNWGIETYNGSQPQDAYFIWDFGDGTLSDDFQPAHEYFDLEPYTITLYSITDIGCTDSISQVFYPFMDVYIPTAFTPNNDGINDVFKAEGMQIREFELWVFNRWGEEVFYSNDLEEYWTGSHSGGEYYVQNEVYTWRVRAVGNRGNSIEKSGTVTVIR